MRRLFVPLVGCALLFVGCSDDETSTPPPSCAPVCGPCQTCDTSGATPTCVENCGPDLQCQDEKCIAPATQKCDPACGACQMCDTSGATPTCVDICASGTSCENGKCVSPAVSECEPACGDCQRCDTSEPTPKCVNLCADGLQCKDKQCVAFDACAGACSSCERCETKYGVPICVDACKLGSCDSTKNVCVPDAVGPTFDHSKLPELAGPFTTDIAGGKAVTAACISCHAKAANDMIDSAHWKWLGPTPGIKGSTPGSIGKQNLINNFCVAVPSNEQRCAHCHASYGYKDNTFDFSASNKGAIDCLVCHAKTNYKRGKTSMGPDSSDPTVDLVKAAQSVGKPTVAACGRCHFGAGGGDNVKKGDLGSALKTATAATDVHMGAATNKLSCASCHKGANHKITGQGVHLPVSEGRLGCADCHGEKPHNNLLMDNHVLDIACQTCHIPAFSRQQPTKMDWDWSTAGNKSKGTGGVVVQKVDGVDVTVYDFMKGDFVWKSNVKPTYAWYDGGVTRLTIKDQYPAGKGTEQDPINLGGPTATKADMNAKIFPFKVMKGKQAVDPTRRLVLVPKLFGPGGFWPGIPATYNASVVEALWTTSLTAGARYSGQIGATESYTGRGSGANQWDWAYTVMWMGINHEVAPKAQSLGCSKCHGASKAEWDWEALGYTCDPQTGPVKCGARNPL